MQTLEEAQATNRRLNRRLGEAEASLNSWLHTAQKEAKDAQERCGRAQAQTRRFATYYTDATRKRIDAERTRDRLGLWAVIFALVAFAEAGVILYLIAW